MDFGTASWVDAETTAIHHPVWKSCIVRVDRELVLACQQAGEAPFRGKPAGSLSPVWPLSGLRDEILIQAREFIRHMRKRGLEPQQSEFQLELWGPYRDRVDLAKGAERINIEEGNPFFPEGRYVTAARSAGPAQRGPLELTPELLDHPDIKGVHFIVRGQFTRTYGKQSEETGQLIF
jgi:hypothetical protein